MGGPSQDSCQGALGPRPALLGVSAAHPLFSDTVFTALSPGSKVLEGRGRAGATGHHPAGTPALGKRGGEKPDGSQLGLFSVPTPTTSPTEIVLVWSSLQLAPGGQFSGSCLTPGGGWGFLPGPQSGGLHPPSCVVRVRVQAHVGTGAACRRSSGFKVGSASQPSTLG